MQSYEALQSAIDSAWELLEARLTTLPPPLDALAQRYLTRISDGDKGHRGYFSSRLAPPLVFLPLWLRERFRREQPDAAPSEEVTVRIVASAMWGYLYIRIQDDLLDEASPARSQTLLGNVCIFEMAQLLGKLAADSAAFRAAFERAWIDFTRWTLAEHEQLLSNAEYDRERFEQHTRKVAFARIPALAVCTLAGHAALEPTVERLVDQLGVAYGLTNDVVGWQRDLANGHRTFLLARAGFSRGMPVERARHEVREALYGQGLVIQTLEESAAWQRRAAESAQALGLAEFADYTRERLALLDELGYEARLLQLRWVLAGGAAAPGARKETPP
ncbi:MAG: class 1 isoprenoid biosynthesis enzyme [Hyalangium sp.]|uniref:class 1 isoprenoid biosynthesis enzyme n=1 Tax=Hyalangium sp. TaxID=2028555 RepID=UPI00389A7DEB